LVKTRKKGLVKKNRTAICSRWENVNIVAKKRGMIIVCNKHETW
jgi:hypothetical protein